MFILRNSRDSMSYDIFNANRFPDRTLALGKINDFYDEILWKYEGDEEFFTLMCLREHMGKEKIKLVMPYIPHARMDRTVNGEVFTLKTFCKAINSMNFSKVIVVDPHSDVSIALLDRVKVISPKKYIENTMYDIYSYSSIKETVVFFPDEGAMKRYSKLFPNLEYTFGIKNRDWNTGKIEGFNIVNSKLVQGKNVLIIDDICSRGGTFHHASKALDAAGANSIYLYVTHCEDTVFSGDMYKGKLVKKIYTTNSKLSFTGSDDKIEVIYNFNVGFKNGEIF